MAVEAARAAVTEPSRSRKARPRVWVVSELYYPEETSTGHVMTQLAEGLAGDADVLALCGQPTYSARGVRAPSSERRGCVHITRCSGTTLDKDRLLFRLTNMVTLSASMVWHAWRLLRRDDVVLVVTNPPVLPFLITLVCRAHDARCILVIHDVYPEAIIAARMLSAGSMTAGAIDRLNRWLYGAVDRVSVCGRDMRALVLKKLGVEDDSRVVIIPNWADPICPTPRESNPLLNELGLGGKFVVQYVGNMGLVHGIETLFDAARQLAAFAPDIHFLFIGSGAKKKWLEEAVAAARLDNVTILANRPRAAQQVFLNACDVTISAFRTGMAGAGVPSRMYNIMAAGKPMIAAVDEASEQALVIREEGVGWVVPPEQPARVVEAILEARADPGRLAAMGRRARVAVDRDYRLAHAVAAYRDLIDVVIDARS